MWKSNFPSIPRTACSTLGNNSHQRFAAIANETFKSKRWSSIPNCSPPSINGMLIAIGLLLLFSTGTRLTSSPFSRGLLVAMAFRPQGPLTVVRLIQGQILAMYRFDQAPIPATRRFIQPAIQAHCQLFQDQAPVPTPHHSQAFFPAPISAKFRTCRHCPKYLPLSRRS